MSRDSHTADDSQDRKRRHDELRRRVQERLALRRRQKRERPPVKAPRYDEVFWKGTEWLNTL